MIGKIVKPGKSFKGCIEYNLLKQQAELLDAAGVRTANVKTIIDDFNFQRKANPGLGQAVGHISLSWSANDAARLSNEVMVKVAKEYMEQMKITNTQYLIARHFDRAHPHLHIVYNRVNNEGKTISDRFQKRQNIKVCKALTLQYGYYISPGKEQVNRERLKGTDKIKYEIYDALSQLVKQAKSWEELERQLLLQGITLQYKYRSGTTEVQGISFCKWDVKFKGSEIDRSLSYSKISQQLEQNRQENKQAQIPQAQPSKAAEKMPQQANDRPGQFAKELIATLLRPEMEQPLPNELSIYKKKRKRKKIKL